MIVVQTVLFAR